MIITVSLCIFLCFAQVFAEKKTPNFDDAANTRIQSIESCFERLFPPHSQSLKTATFGVDDDC